MKKVKPVLFSIILSTLAVFLSGCWNYREIDQLYMVAGFAVDPGTNGKYLLTAEIVDIKMAGEKAEFSSKKVSAEGETFLNAIRNIISISGKKLYWSHAKVAILSQDTAREGITQIIDLITRDSEPRLELNILVSKEKTARELLFYSNTEKDLISLEMENMIKSQRSLSNAPTTKTYMFADVLSAESQSEVLPAIGFVTNEGKKVPALSGTAVFKKDRLVGFLDENETKYMLFVKNRIKGGILPEIAIPGNSRRSIALEVSDSKTRLLPAYSHGKISMDLEVKTTAVVNEHGPVASYINGEGRNILNKAAEESLEANIRNVVRKVQKQYGTDILGFGSAVKQKMPSLWKHIADDWNRIFEDLDVDVHAKMDIRSSGLKSKPVKVGK